MVGRTTVVDRTTVIPSPPDVVFAAVMSPDTAPLIDPGVREWRPDAEPIGVGTRFSIRGRLGVLPIRGTQRVRAMGAAPTRGVSEHCDVAGSDDCPAPLRATCGWWNELHVVDHVSRSQHHQPSTCRPDSPLVRTESGEPGRRSDQVPPLLASPFND